MDKKQFKFAYIHCIFSGADSLCMVTVTLFYLRQDAIAILYGKCVVAVLSLS